MKYLDEVRLIISKKEYEGSTGVIIMPEIRYGFFELEFCNVQGTNSALIPVHVGNLELVRDAGMSDETILESLPLQNPRWWCKVENGFMLNLLGEKKNKIPYAYNS